MAANESVQLAPLTFGSSPYDGANASPRRGYVDWGTLDTRAELDAFSREELVRRVRWLCKNIGFVKRLVNGLADLVGDLKPQARTGDQEWNALAELNFMTRAGSPLVFDAAGKIDFFDAQILQTRTHFRDGELLTLLSESDASKGAQVKFVEAHHLRDPENASSRWKDGVLANNHDRHVAYGIKTRAKSVSRVSADNVLYFGAWESCGHHRSVPPLAHGVNHSIDITEIWADNKHAIKTAGLVGAFITNTDDKSARNPKGLTTSITPQKTPTGEAFNSAKIWMGEGGGSAPELEKGKDLKILHDDRPHPNIRNLISDLLRDISWGTGCPPEVVWEMTGLAGPGVRFVLEILDLWIARKQKPLKTWSTRYWVYHIAKEIKAGRLPECRDPQWWKVDWIGQKSMSIDRSRDKDQLDLYDGGMTTLQEFYDRRSADWREKVVQKITERKFIVEECKRQKLDPEEVFRPRQGAAVSSRDSDEDDEPEDQNQPENS